MSAAGRMAVAGGVPHSALTTGATGSLSPLERNRPWNIGPLPSAFAAGAGGLADGLMTQAHAENRQFTAKMFDHINRHAGFVRRARAGGNDDPLRVEGFDFGNGELIVAHDFDLGTELTEVLHNVVSKRVVVIDHQQHGVKNLLNLLTLNTAFE